MSTAGYGVFYEIVRQLLKAVPVDAAGRRVFDETLADWRREILLAGAPGQRVATALRHGLAVCRSVLFVSAGELRSPGGAAPLWRFAAWTAASAVLFFALNAELLYVINEAGRAPYGYGSLGLLSVSWLAGLMPILAFLAGAGAKHTGSPGSRLGPALFMCAVTVIVLGWITPAANQAFREMTFARGGNTGVVNPGLAELSVSSLIGRLWTEEWLRAAVQLNFRLLWVTAVPVLLAIGTTARSLTGWRRLAGSAAPLFIFWLPFALGTAWPDRLWAFWGGLLASAGLVYLLARRAESDDQAIHAGGASA